MKSVFTSLFILATMIALVYSCSTGSTKKVNKVKDVEEVNIEINVKKEVVSFQTDDNLVVTADLYTHQNAADRPFIILFHQAGYSRGEYNETADKFLELGYNCLATDQRSGKEVNGVINKTHLEAIEKGLPTEYTDAMPDLLAAIGYVRDTYDPEKLFILGSSYSAILSLIIAAQDPDAVDAVLAFSPGEYFEYEEADILDYASEILVPVFITSAKSEYPKWQAIYKLIPDEGKRKFVPEVESIHGSRALWETTEGSEACWEAVKDFLNDK
jgi:dienelactone hydrolase